MDPLGTVQALISVISYLYEAVEKVKENKEECARLCSHVESLAKSIESEYADETIPPKLDARLEGLTRSVVGILAITEAVVHVPTLQYLDQHHRDSGGTRQTSVSPKGDLAQDNLIEDTGCV